MLKLYGSSLSPYVRKVMLLLEHKGVAYENDPVSPVRNPSAEFLRLSPLRKIPVLVDGDLVLPDSSVICRYLEDLHPEPALYPADVRARAFACWLEEYADTKLVDCVGPLLGERVFKPRLFGTPTDEARVAQLLRDVLPQALGYLESVAPATGFACGELSIADFALGSVFTNGRYAAFEPDAGSYPKLVALLDRVYATPAFAARLARDRTDYPPLFATAPAAH